MKYDIQLVDPAAARRSIGTAFGHLSDAMRFALKLADDLGDPGSQRALRFGSVKQVLVRRANMTEMAITVFRK